jgi:hypothetical protein
VRYQRLSSAWDGLVNNKSKTELPHYAVNKSLPADSYFTSPETAQKCIDIANRVIPDGDYIYVEPSAGEGVFYNLLPEDHRIGIELHDRKCPEFIQADYLTWYPKETDNYIVVGNPPFGVRGAIALAFINRSFLFADYVAFVLPMSFHSNGKGSNMKRVKNGHLIHSEVLYGESFFSPDNNKEIKVNTLFQIWKKGEGKGIFLDYDISKYADIYTVCSSPDRLCGLDKIEKYDFYVSSSFFGESLPTVYNFEDVKYGSGYGVILKTDKEDILNKIDNVEWNDYSSLATNSCKHIRKYGIEKCLFDLGYGMEKTQSIGTLEEHLHADN